MTEATASPGTTSRFMPSFHFWLTCAMCGFVFAGFGMTYLFPLTAGSFAPAPPIVHLHALIFFSWMLLLLTQSALVSAGNVRLHRSLGTYGIAHATFVLYTGALIQLIASARGFNSGRPAGTDGLYLGVLAVIGFATLFTLAIRNATRPQIHKRLILFAMLPVLPPGVNRFWANLLGLSDAIPTFWLYLTLWSFAAALLIQERRSTGKIGVYSMFGAGWILLQGALHELVVGSETFNAFAAGLLGLVHYR